MRNYKKLSIALAVAFALPAAAQADVTIYGFLSGGVESAKATGNGSAEFKTATRVVDNSSRIGFKGNEDLGNGLKAVWQVESSLRNFEQGGTSDSGSTATFATRNTFIGLQGSSWGTVLLGNYDSAYKRLTDVDLNVFSGLSTDNHGKTQIFSRLEERLKNSLHYTSPVFSGFQAGASYQWDEAPNTGTSADVSKNRWDVAALYSNAGLKATVGYDHTGNQISQAAGKASTTKGYKVAASYTIPATGTLIGAGFERVTNEINSQRDTNQNDWLVAVAQPVTGALTLKGSYGQLGKLSGVATGNPDDYKAKQWVLGASYAFTKRTQAYVYGTKITNNKAQNVNFGLNPIYTTGLGTSSAKLDAGNSPQAFGIGLKTVF